jgi:hypothetical protein
MYLNAFRIRLALMAAGLVTIGLYLAMGGRFGPDPRGGVVIEFGADPAEFEGLTVAIDGRAVGSLKHVGGLYRTAFAVAGGAHQVRIDSPRYSCRPVMVTIGDGKHVALMLDFAESMAAAGTEKPELYLH